MIESRDIIVRNMSDKEVAEDLKISVAKVRQIKKIIDEIGEPDGVEGHDEALEEINDIIGGFGVDGIVFDETGAAMDYVNRGEAYTPTVVYDVDSMEFIISSWGGWYEGVQEEQEESVHDDVIAKIRSEVESIYDDSDYFDLEEVRSREDATSRYTLSEIWHWIWDSDDVSGVSRGVRDYDITEAVVMDFLIQAGFLRKSDKGRSTSLDEDEEEEEYPRMFCGDCGKRLTDANRYSDYTCKVCARRLGISDSDEDKGRSASYDIVDDIISYEEGEMDSEDVLKLFSKLVKNGQAWSLQGHYGRTAMSLINAGFLNRAGDINWDKFNEEE